MAGAAPQLVVLSGPHRGTTLVLSHPFPVVFGRKAGMALPEPALEDVHCQVFQADGRWFLQDFASREGTWIGDERVDGVRPLEPGRAFRIGTTHVGLVEGDKDPEERLRRGEPGKDTEPTLMAELVETPAPLEAARPAHARAPNPATDLVKIETPPEPGEETDSALPVAQPEGQAPPPLSEHGSLGEYDLLEPLGAGGLGQVWKAYDRKRRRVVALKVLAPEHARDSHAVARFLRGAKAGGKLHHPHLVSILAAGHAGRHVYLTMEYVEGIDLERTCVARGGQLPAREAVAIVARVVEALVYAHSRGVVHRNVTPANILVGPGDLPKLADLTLAKKIQGGKGSLEITRSDDVLVRSVYAPPEAIFDVQRVDVRTDVYGCGATLFRAATGKPPYSHTSPAELVQGRHADPSELAPHLSAGLQLLLRRCLRPDPNDRYPTMAALREALADLPESAET